MKPKFEIIQGQIDCSFLLREFGKEAFHAPFHFHPDYELTLILKGNGTRYIGNNMAPFGDEDLVLLGPDIPHCWKLETEDDENINCIVIHFLHDFLGDGFFSGAELASIHNLLTTSVNGLIFKKEIKEKVIPQIISLAQETDKFIRLMRLLEILHQLSQGDTYFKAEQKYTEYKPLKTGPDRINLIMAYIVENFRNDVSLTEAAKIVNMTPNALCKYFKKLTRKTFLETVLEYRLNYAAQQLVQSDKLISLICYDSGFNDISYFNKVFKSRLNASPLNYRKKFFKF